MPVTSKVVKTCFRGVRSRTQWTIFNKGVLKLFLTLCSNSFVTRFKSASYIQKSIPGTLFGSNLLKIDWSVFQNFPDHGNIKGLAALYLKILKITAYSLVTSLLFCLFCKNMAHCTPYFKSRWGNETKTKVSRLLCIAKKRYESYVRIHFFRRSIFDIDEMTWIFHRKKARKVLGKNMVIKNLVNQYII